MLYLYKLKAFGTCENTPSWFQSYLLNRDQCVNLKDVISIPKRFTIVVLQGSI